MLPLVGVTSTIAEFLKPYREVFSREAGFKHISNYINGLLVSENKTLQGIHSQIVSKDEEKVSRRAVHEAVFEAGWKYSELMEQQRKVVAPLHKGRGREVIALDWTLSYHPYSKKIFGARERLLELLHYQKNRLAYRKRTEIAVEMVRQIETEGQFPDVDYAFDQGMLSVPLTKIIEASGKHGVTEIERSRNIMWHGQWQRVERVAQALKTEHPESFRHLKVGCRNGETKEIWSFTKVVRLRKYGRKRLVIVHEKSDLSDNPRFLLTDALHWDASRVFSTWSYRWSVEI